MTVFLWVVVALAGSVVVGLFVGAFIRAGRGPRTEEEVSGE